MSAAAQANTSRRVPTASVFPKTPGPALPPRLAERPNDVPGPLLLHLNDRLGAATSRLVDIGDQIEGLLKRTFGDAPSTPAGGSDGAPSGQGPEAVLRVAALHDHLTRIEHLLAFLMGNL